MKRNVQKSILIFLLGLFCMGFRLFPGGNTWSIGASDPTLWVRICKSASFDKNDIPAGDALYNTNPSFTQITQSIFDDYNGIPGSFIRLAAYPADPNNPGAPLAGDSTFTIGAANVRTIDVCFETQTTTSGYTRQKIFDSKVIGCTIQLSDTIFKSTKGFIATLTHELGHCLGLNHPQETTKSVMSYFSGALRLQDDDKMGMVYAYPTDPAFAKEDATFGLRCSPKN